MPCSVSSENLILSAIELYFPNNCEFLVNIIKGSDNYRCWSAHLQNTGHYKVRI